MNIIGMFNAAKDRCKFPGMENYRFQILLHENGHGKHRILTLVHVPNMDEKAEVKGLWKKDRDGRTIVKMVEPGEMIDVGHFFDFDYEDAAEPMFFEKALFRIYAQFGIHEIFETFQCDEERMYNPHHSKWHRKKSSLEKGSWRNTVLWEAIDVAMEHNPPELKRSEKLDIWVHETSEMVAKQYTKRKHKTLSMFWSWVHNLKDLRNGYWKDPYVVYRKLVFTCFAFDSIISEIFGVKCSFLRRNFTRRFQPLYRKLFKFSPDIPADVWVEKKEAA